MPDTFTPLSRLPLANTSAFVPLHLKLSTPSKPEPVETKKTAPAAETCASPKITLQKENDVVTGIRIECPCGQITELSCVY